MDKELKQLMQTGEGYHLEFKESLDKSLIEEVCAFANSSGGKVLLGVSDDGEIKGISTDNNILSRIQNVVNRLEPKLNIKISVSESLLSSMYFRGEKNRMDVQGDFLSELARIAKS